MRNCSLITYRGFDKWNKSKTPSREILVIEDKLARKRIDTATDAIFLVAWVVGALAAGLALRLVLALVLVAMFVLPLW